MSQATATDGWSDLAAANREVVRKFLTLLGTEEQFEYLGDLTFSSVDGDPDTAFIEYSGGVNTPGGHTYLQTYFNQMRFRDGTLSHMREVRATKLITDAASGAFDGASAN